MVAERIEKWEASLPAFIKLAYLPNPMLVRLRLSAMGDDVEKLKEGDCFIVSELSRLGRPLS